MYSAQSIIWPPNYHIKKHKRARHVKLRATKTSGLVVTIPWRYPLKEIPAVLEEHKEWIVKQLQALAEKQTVELPTEINLRGCDSIYRVEYLYSNQRLKLIERPQKELVVYGNISDHVACKALLIKWLRQRTTQILSQQLSAVSLEIQLPFSKLTVRDQQTVWGSCTRQKAISLSYRLIFLPISLMRHIMIHELSHTVHLNHSDKFWSLVAKYDPNWQANRLAMRQANQYMPDWI